MVYLAPESLLFIAEEEGGILTRKLDVFALGVLFHQYLSGDLPGFNHEKYDYAFEAVLDGCELEIHPSIPDYFKEILRSMLEREPDKRPNVEEIFTYLTKDDMRTDFAEPKPITKPLGNTSGVFTKQFFNKARTTL